MAFKKMHAVVKGRVQGVGYRFFAQRMAHLIGITGWVKNLPSGNVEILAVGADDKIRDFLISIERGPTMSEVTEVESEIEDCDYNDFQDFNINF